MSTAPAWLVLVLGAGDRTARLLGALTPLARVVHAGDVVAAAHAMTALDLDVIVGEGALAAELPPRSSVPVIAVGPTSRPGVFASVPVDVSGADLAVLVASAARSAQLEREVRRLAEAMVPQHGAPEPGLDPALAEACARAAQATSPVLIEGEPGSGRTRLGRALHLRGPRARAPFVVIDGASATAARELAGVEGKRGLLRQAHGGTLLVRDVDQASPAVQALLTQLLDEGAVLPEGASQPVAVDVRLVVTTARGAERLHQDLQRHLADLRLVLPHAEPPPSGRPLREILAAACAHIERQALREALDLEGGSPTRAARRLGISRASFYNKLKEHGFTS
jgi:DNA-binding NtrC family response regulator